jgi:hypothetical protein
LAVERADYLVDLMGQQMVVTTVDLTVFLLAGWKVQ